ncbi:diacylglycerol kinase [Vibrio crassostreae]|uniref:diacylglycerol kinase n=1 Tax=Vibrio crassostreae TaxID=246167 RepID=UPI00104DF84C|nr:diacylglycerol kinase [Vibrio crassostreae]TCN84374.1 diacylglycerol kinase [Vibrio crassostreae]TCN92835.1 diacylglycerol kinase [Vibrio crassostreae]CAK1935311.1 diacylglycerol kinase [Vibrio crassostreae]CAK1943526.1 diacylglycerol kinase [Vibrio crassostreae]CAK1948740.1 diacylglycerol kinase [Vibrio crassostreae]
MTTSLGKPGAAGIKRILNAAGYSIKGLTSAFKTEAAIRQELALCVIFIPIAFVLDISKVETILMVASLVLVFLFELINSAIEAVVDRVGTEHHELSGKAKDIGSAAVMVSLGLALFTWLYILI